MTFNEKIDKFMKDNNIDNLKQLAQLSEIPYTTLKDFYDKKSADNSRLSTIRKLSKYMNCSMDYLAYEDCDICIVDKIDFKKNALKELINQDYNDSNFSEFEILFDKHKDILTDSDKAVIKTIIEERQKEIDKELGENE